MKIELGQYRLAHLSGDEICVLGAFLKFPCLYGMSAGWMKPGYLGMEERVLRTAAALEQKGVILMEPGGMVRMEEGLYGLVTDMGSALCLGRVAYSCGREQGRIYLYHTGSSLVTAEWDQRGNYFLGRMGLGRELEESLENVEEQENSRQVLGNSWLGAIVMERKGILWERVYDLAWTREEGSLATAWGGLCHSMLSEKRESV